MRHKWWLCVLLIFLVIVALASSFGPQDASASYYRRNRLRIFEGANHTGAVLYTIERVPFVRVPAWWVFRGPSRYYPPAYTFTNDRVYEGNALFYGPILATFRNDLAYLGPSIVPSAVLRLASNRLFSSASLRGPILFNFHSRRMFAGANHTGEIVAYVTEDIAGFDGPLELMMGLLFTGQLQEAPPPPTPPPPPPPPGS